MTIRERFEEALDRVWDPDDLVLKRKLRFLVSSFMYAAFVVECRNQARVADPYKGMPVSATYNGILLITSPDMGTDEIRVIKILA